MPSACLAPFHHCPLPECAQSPLVPTAHAKAWGTAPPCPRSLHSDGEKRAFPCLQGAPAPSPRPSWQPPTHSSWVCWAEALSPISFFPGAEHWAKPPLHTRMHTHMRAHACVHTHTHTHCPEGSTGSEIKHMELSGVSRMGSAFIET